MEEHLANQGENRPVLIDCVFEEQTSNKEDNSSLARGN